MIVIALDPGRTTGYAFGEINEQGLMIVVTGQQQWKHFELLKQLQESKPSYVICERFVYRHGGKRQWGADLYPKELIGVCELYAQDPSNECELVQQNVLKDNPTTYFNNDRLKEAYLYKPGREHANDAARHILHWFKFGSGFQFNKLGYKTGALA